jgi:cell division protein FtsL
MIAANEWHKYQENYIKYGIDLTPEAPRKKKVASKTTIRVSAQERTLILMLIAAVGICCIAMVFLQACASHINYNVYKLNQEIESVSGEIDNLNVELSGYNKLDDIEYAAQNSLGMVHPSQDQYVYVADMTGSKEVDDYIEALSDSQRGMEVKKNATVSVAAKHLLAQV